MPSSCFRSVKGEKRVSDFHAEKRMRHGVAGALVDGVILQPNINGIGFDLKKFFARP